MAFDSVPWIVAGGAVHSAEVGRAVPYFASGGAEGVAEFDHLKVTALDTPGTSVQVAAGVCGIINTYGSEIGQTYVGRAISDTLQAIAATSGSPRSDMIVARIDDPQYGGTTPGDPAVGPYIMIDVISNVDSDATEIPGDVTYPAIPLARIDIPASTATIIDAYITDIRQVPKPRKERALLTVLNVGSTVLAVDSPTQANWPDTDGWQVSVPRWATKAVVVGQVHGVKFASSGGAGRLAVRLGTDGDAVTSQQVAYTGEIVGRQSLATADEIIIPAAYRGTEQTVAIRGTNISGSGGQRADADQWSVGTLDIEFIEDPSVA